MLDSNPPTAGEKLLRYFDTNPAIAAEKLLRCRQKLVRRFAAEHCHDAEDLANETLRRVLQVLDRDEKQLTTTIEAFISGFATNVIHEIHRRPDSQRIALEELSPAQEPRCVSLEELELAFSREEALWSCLKQCLDKLTQTDRETLVRYYDSALHEKLKEVRERMALSLGLTSAQLRKHTFKLRAQVEACINECLAHWNKIQNPS